MISGYARDRLKFWTTFLCRAKVKLARYADISPTEYGVIATGAGSSGLNFQCRITKHTGTVELAIAKDAAAESKVVFN